jgi:transmembrane sensor
MANEPVVNRETAENEAAAWIARRDTAQWDAAAFERWLAESVSHRAAYYRLNAAWTEAGRLGALTRPARADAVFESLTASVLKSPEVGTGSSAEPQSLRGPLRQSRVSVRRTPWVLAASVVLALGIAVAVYQYERTPPNRFTTVVGGLEAVPLPDGSRVTLNTDSEVQVSLELKERVVNLDRGEAYFEVAKDRIRPFIVNAGKKRVIAVGTQFSVRRDGDNVEVIVTEGTVRMESRGARSKAPPAQPQRLSSSRDSPEIVPSVGSPAMVSSDSAGSADALLLGAGSVARARSGAVLVQKAAPAEIEQHLSWRSGLLTFRDTPLADAVAEFNRYNERKIVIEDPSIASLQLGGIFRSTNIDPFIELLEQGFPVRAKPEGNRILLTHN